MKTLMIERTRDFVMLAPAGSAVAAVRRSAWSSVAISKLAAGWT
jgi:hypothetical protein